MTLLGYIQESDSQVFLNMSNVFGLEYTLNFFTNMYWYRNQYNAFALNPASIQNALQTVSPTPAQDIPPLDYFNFDMFDDKEDCVTEKCDDNEDDECVMEKCEEDDKCIKEKCADVYSCRFCGLIFASTDGARKHCRKHHPIFMQDVTRGKPDQYCVRVVKKK